MSKLNLRDGVNYYTNFHCHTSASDGFCTDIELIERAIEQNPEGTMILAITDHNQNPQNFKVIQEKYKDQIILLPGCEVSTTYPILSTGRKIEVHIIALDYDLDSKEFADMLLRNQHDKRGYVEEILQKLDNIGIHVADNYEELLEFVKPSSHVGRMAISRMMVKKGITSTIDEGFDKYFGSYGEKKCYVDNSFEFVSIEECVSTIRNSGGISILCHPILYDLTKEELLELIALFAKSGGDAMEVFYPSHSDEERNGLLQICQNHGLNPSAGSDYHGNAHEHLRQKYPGEIAVALLNTKRG